MLSVYIRPSHEKIINNSAFCFISSTFDFLSSFYFIRSDFELYSISLLENLCLIKSDCHISSNKIYVGNICTFFLTVYMLRISRGKNWCIRGVNGACSYRFSSFVELHIQFEKLPIKGIARRENSPDLYAAVCM